jgi:hypothetical protein
MKKLSILALMLTGVLGVYAQDSSTTSTSTSGGDAADYAPAAGDFSGALLFGRGNFLDVPVSMVPATVNSGWFVPGSGPSNTTVDANNNSVTNMVGAEVRYFLADNIALKLSGGAIIRNTPSVANTPGFIDSGTNQAAWIPAYQAVKADNSVQTNINLGAEYHFASKYNRVFPYMGVTVPFYYARQSFYDPTIIYADNNSSTIDIVDIGIRSAEVVGFGGQLVAGFDFYLFEGFYTGFEIKPVSYVYSYVVKSPGPGLATGQAQNSTISFLTQPFLKLGFRF